MKNSIKIPRSLLDLAKENMPLLKSQNVKRKLDTVELNISGYADVMYLMADIVKVCMLALESNTSSNRIPEPETNISGVLGIVLDLIPYEEADFLDTIREIILNPTQDTYDDLLIENFFLQLPTQLLDA